MTTKIELEQYCDGGYKILANGKVVADISCFDDTGFIRDKFLTFNFNPIFNNAPWHISHVESGRTEAHVFMAKGRDE